MINRYMKAQIITNEDKIDIKNSYENNELSVRKLTKKYHASEIRIRQILKEMGVQTKTVQEHNKSRMMKHSEETKRIMSEFRKKFLKENPDKHPWRKSTKFTSVPCENLKKMLKDSGYVFETEFCPPEINRSYSLDIAFTDRKLAIEVNGNQHYNRDGTLKDYYKERHAILEQHGWTILEIHYSTCFSESSMEMIRTFIQSKQTSPEYEAYIKDKITKKGIKRVCCDCGCEIHKFSMRCRGCSNKLNTYENNNQTKLHLPADEIFKILKENNMNFLKTGRQLGVSDNAVRKRLKKAKLI